MAGTEKHYFAEGNTALGPYHLYESAFQKTERLVTLTGMPGTGKSVILRRIADALLADGYEVELFHSPSDSSSLDALNIDALKLGVVGSSAGRLALSGRPDTEVRTVDLNGAVRTDELTASRDRLDILRVQIQAAYGKAYYTFSQALRVHDEWERFYIESMLFDEANKVTEELIESFFGERVLDKTGSARHLFLGAATPAGAVDFVPGITEGAKRRIFVKGRPGSGKSTMLKKLAAAAAERGFDAEIFHCGFDPNSLDMVVFPEIGVAIFDSTAPHEHDPSREGDEILDMYERAMLPGTDEKYAGQVSGIRTRYKDTMSQATAYLAEAKALNDELQGIHAAAVDTGEVERLGDRLLAEIRDWTAAQGAR
ncbi:hypothetical protein ACFFNY_35470 [Paenibacillus hodogayensis]|uniref:Nucleotide kinase n=1 Tax=Paenibacillus hodogayensis TaxID=279208 RepID=A0ABV5W8J0_9BACL